MLVIITIRSFPHYHWVCDKSNKSGATCEAGMLTSQKHLSSPPAKALLSSCFSASSTLTNSIFTINRPALCIYIS